MKASSAFLFLACAAGVSAADWTQWRGPGRDNHSPDKSIVASFPEGGPKKLWMFENAGKGYSSFSLAGDRLFTMGSRDDIEHVICLDRKSGKELWAAPLGPVYTNRWGDGPRSTPTVDGDSVYALTGRGVLGCVSAADGKVRWKVDLVKDHGGELQGWGYTESVLVDGDRVVCTPGGKKGTMLALNKKDGKPLWQSKDLDENAQYSSPILIQFQNQPQYVQRTMQSVFGISPADGKLLWKTSYPGRVAVIPTPIHADGIVYVTAGYGCGCKAVKLGGEDPETLYQEDVITNHHGGVILVDGHIYGHSDKGGWSCQDLKSGKVLWQDKGTGKGTCVYVAGKLVTLAEDDGTVALIDASTSGYKEHGKFKLEPQSQIRSKDGRIWTHPVVLDGRLYLRDQDLIYCYDVSGK